MNENKEAVKAFLRDNFNYHVMHEASSTQPDIEHFFVGINKNGSTVTINLGKESKTLTIKHPEIVMQYLAAYEKHNPLKDLSATSKSYMKEKKEQHFFILIDSLNKNDTFYLQNKNMVINNAANILSLKMVGEVADVSSHLEQNATKYVEQFKEISTVFGSIAKDNINEKLAQGKVLFEEKAPVVKKNLEDIGAKISNKLSAFRKKL